MFIVLFPLYRQTPTDLNTLLWNPIHSWTTPFLAKESGLTPWKHGVGGAPPRCQQSKNSKCVSTGAECILLGRVSIFLTEIQCCHRYVILDWKSDYRVFASVCRRVNSCRNIKYEYFISSLISDPINRSNITNSNPLLN